MATYNRLNEYYDKARQGDIQSQKQLGFLLSRSQGTLDTGIAWLKKAASTDPDAMYMLFLIYLKKLSDKQEAFYWCKKAAKNNHIDAMINIGALYLYGCGVAQDTGKAIQWYKAAARLGSSTAYHNLGFLCYQDSTLYQNALDYFTIAAELGYADSAYMLGVMYLQGQGVKPNPSLALEHLEHSVRLGKHYACRPIGDLYFQGTFDNGTQNYEKAIQWYQQGAAYGVLSCIEVLGDCHYYGIGVDIDYSLAYDFYCTAADMGSPDAAFMLGTMFMLGESVNKNYREALKWMTIAQSKGVSKATEFVKSLSHKIAGNAAAVPSAVAGNAGIQLRRSYSAEMEAMKAEQRAIEQQERKRSRSIYAAAGAMSGHGSYTDYEMGAVINTDGEVSYVDTDLGIILGADGSVSSHNANTGLTYNWSSGGVMAYDEKLNATLDFSSGEISYNLDGYTIK